MMWLRELRSGLNAAKVLARKAWSPSSAGSGGRGGKSGPHEAGRKATHGSLDALFDGDRSVGRGRSEGRGCLLAPGVHCEVDSESRAAASWQWVDGNPLGWPATLQLHIADTDGSERPWPVALAVDLQPRLLQRTRTILVSMHVQGEPRVDAVSLVRQQVPRGLTEWEPRHHALTPQWVTIARTFVLRFDRSCPLDPTRTAQFVLRFPRGAHVIRFAHLRVC